MRRMHISSLFDQLSMQIFYFDRGLKMQICACLIGCLKQPRLPPCQTKFSLNDIHSILSWIVVPSNVLKPLVTNAHLKLIFSENCQNYSRLGGEKSECCAPNNTGNKTKQKSIFMTSCSFILIVFCITATNCQMWEKDIEK